MIKILLVEDHHLVREGIKMLIEKEDNMSVIAEANSGEEALDLLSDRHKDIDVVITDINMEKMDGLSLTQKIRETFPHIKVIILSMVREHAYLSKSFDCGASAYLLKDMDYNELVLAVSHVAAGGKYVCEDLMLDIVSQLGNYCKDNENSKDLIERLDLSEREMEVLNLIGEGYTNLEIANKLFLSKRTVEGHRQNLIDKTRVKNSAQLVKYAVKQGII